MGVHRKAGFWSFIAILFMIWLETANAGSVVPSYVDNQYNGNPNDTCPAEGTENPIHIPTGNKYHEENIFQGGGEFPLEFNLYYNSRRTIKPQQNPAFIAGQWTHSYGQQLIYRKDLSPPNVVPSAGIYEMVRPDGQSYFYNCSWSVGPCAGQIRTEDAVLGFALNNHQHGLLERTENYGGFVFTSLEGVSETYDTDGRLTQVKNLQGGGTHQIAYINMPINNPNPGALGTMEITHLERNEVLTFTLQNMWTKRETIEGVQTQEFKYYPYSLSTPDGHSYQFLVDYDSHKFSDCTGSSACLYIHHRLEKITWPTGGNTQFSYSSDTNITSSSWRTTALSDIDVYESSGDHTFSASYDYDIDGRAYLSRHGAGDVSLRQEVWDDGDGHNWTVRNRLAKSTVYNFNLDSNGIPRLSSVKGNALAQGNCSESNVSYSYNPLGYRDIVTYTDTGMVVDYDYPFNGDVNAMGLLNKVTYTNVGNYGDRVIDYAWTTATDDGFRQLKSVSRGGLVTDYTYENGRLKSRTETDNIAGPGTYTREHDRVRTWNYDYTYHDNDSDGLHRVQTLVASDPLGNSTTYTYDAVGDLISITNPLGHTTSFSGHNEYALPTTMVDANGVTSTLGYHPRGWLNSITTDGKTMSLIYDAMGQLESVVFPDNSFLMYSYSDGGRLSSITNHRGDRLEYNPSPNSGFEDFVTKTLKGTQVYRNQTTRFDALGRLWKMYNLDGVTALQEVNYDSQGNPVTIFDGNRIHGSNGPRHIQQLFDSLGRLTSIEDYRDVWGNVRKVTLGYDGLDRVASVHDQQDRDSATEPGVLTNFYYDAFGNLLRDANTTTGIVDYYYDNAGNLTKMTDAVGASVLYTYDALNRIKTIDYPTQADVTYQYDTGTTYGKGRLTAASTSDGRRIDWFYDRSGNVTKAIRKIGAQTYTTSYEYNNANKLTAIHYPNGHIVDYTRINAVVDSIGLREEGLTIADGIQYEPFGPFNGLTYGNGLTLAHTFDGLSRFNTLSSGSVLNQQYSYDSRSNINGITDNNGGPRTQDFTYDYLGHLNYASGDYGIFNYLYDSVGNRTGRTWQQGAPEEFNEVYDYPDMNGTRQLMSITGTGLGAQNRSFEYTLGKLSSDTAGDRQFLYDDSSRLVTVTEGGMTVASYGYNPLGQRESKAANGEARHFIYGLAGELLYEASSDRYWERNYIYHEGRLLAMAEKSNIWYGLYTEGGAAPDIYQNDSSITVTEADLINGYSYYAYRTLNGSGDVSISTRPRLSPDEGSTTGTEVGLELRESTATNANFVRVARFVRPQGETLRVTYQDITGPHVVDYPVQRYKYLKLEAMAGVVYIYASQRRGDPWDPIGNPIGLTVTSSSVLGFRASGLLNNGWVRFKEIALSGGGLNDTTVYYVHTDHLGTPQAITDANSQVVWDVVYKPFGEVSRIVTGSIENNVRFPGQYYDAETGLHYNYFRDYDPETGRYIQSDPIGLAGGLNRYTYVLNDPINLADPLGLWSISFGGYAGPGGEILFGRDANTGQGFMNFRFGFGLGGGFSWDPLGGRPGSSPDDPCQSGGVGLGVYGDIGFNAGPLQASLQNNLGRNYPTHGDSKPYGQFMSPSAPVGDSWGIRASGAVGGQITIYSGR